MRQKSDQNSIDEQERDKDTEQWAIETRANNEGEERDTLERETRVSGMTKEKPSIKRQSRYKDPWKS